MLLVPNTYTLQKEREKTFLAFCSFPMDEPNSIIFLWLKKSNFSFALVVVAEETFILFWWKVDGLTFPEAVLEDSWN